MVAWAVYLPGQYDILTQVRDANGVWGDVFNISDRGTFTYSYAPVLAAAPDGGIRVIWDEEDPGQRGGICGTRGCRDVWYREWSPTTPAGISIWCSCSATTARPTAWAMTSPLTQWSLPHRV